MSRLGSGPLLHWRRNMEGRQANFGTAATATVSRAEWGDLSISERKMLLKDMRGLPVDFVWRKLCNGKDVVLIKFGSRDECQLVTLSTAKKLLSSVILEHCRKYPGPLYSPDACRWGLTESCVSPAERAAERAAAKRVGDSSAQVGYTRPWSIFKIVLSDGSAPGWEENTYYASAVPTGGTSTSYPIRFYTMQIHCKSTNHEGNSGAQSPNGSNIDRTEGNATARYNLRFPSRDKALWDLGVWCKANKGRPFVIGGPGARRISPRSTSLYIYSSPRILCGSANGECIHAAILNGIAILGGEKDAMTAMQAAHSQWIRHFKDASIWIQKVSGQYGLEKVKNCGMPSIEWLMKRTSGVYIVRIIGTNNVDHCIVVDSRKREIIDSSEVYPMTLSLESLQTCVGEDSELQKIKEVRRLVMYPVSSRKRNKGLKK